MAPWHRPRSAAAGQPATVRLRHGLRLAGVAHTDAIVRPLQGSDELSLELFGPEPARKITELLASAIERIGGIAPVATDHVRQLTVGDRERLLLALHAASFGPRAETVTVCEACGGSTEMTLDLPEALAMPDPDGGGQDRTTGRFVLDGSTVRFRVPNGADQERAASMAVTDPAAAEALLRAACVLSVTDGFGRPAEAEPASLAAALETAVRLADPDAEFVIAVTCAGCGHGVPAVVDGFSLLSGALCNSTPVLEDVHRLAEAYHWTEEAILSLPTERRRHYLALLGRTVAA